MLNLATLVLACAPGVASETMLAVIDVESAGNPYAIGVVGGWLERQPETLEEALATVWSLEADGWDYSVGLAQVNRQHHDRLEWAGAKAFEPCENIAAGAQILADCYTRAGRVEADEQRALRAALSCYYSGGFTYGQRPDSSGTSYVDRVLRRAQVHYYQLTH